MSQQKCLSRRQLLNRSLCAVAATSPVAWVPLPAHALRPAAVNYTANAPDPAKSCAKCLSFIPGPDPDANGECFAVHGSISPKGHCDEWAPKKS